jgi:hypothetical protein
MSQLVIRPAEEADNDGIVALARRCPQEGMITFLFNRGPRFDTINRLLDPEAWHFVACDQGRIVGVVGVIHFQAHVLGHCRKIAYILDLLLDGPYRQGMTAFRLIKPVVQRLYQSDADMVLVNFLKDNHHPLVFTKGRAGLPAATNLGDNTFFSMLSLRTMRIDSAYKIEQPTERDLPELVELYQRSGSHYKIAQVLDEPMLRHYLENIEGLGLENFLVARRNGRIRAVTALWDEIPYKSYEVQKLNFAISSMTHLLKLMSYVAKVPRPIELHKPLSQLSLVLNAHLDCPEAIEMLFRHVNNLHRGSKYTLVTLYGQDNDPITKVIRKFRGLSVKSEMHVFARDPLLQTQLEQADSPVMFNLALLQ